MASVTLSREERISKISGLFVHVDFAFKLSNSFLLFSLEWQWIVLVCFDERIISHVSSFVHVDFAF